MCDVAGASWTRELYEEFAPVREEAGKLTPEAIDEAVAAVHKKFVHRRV